MIVASILLEQESQFSNVATGVYVAPAKQETHKIRFCGLLGDCSVMLKISKLCDGVFQKTSLNSLTVVMNISSNVEIANSITIFFIGGLL